MRPSLDVHLAQPSAKRVSSTISRATKHKKKEKVPFPWVKDLKPNLEKSVNVVKSDAEWWKTLTPEEFRVTREQRVFSHRYYKEKRAGMYNCICCGAPLFSSGTKYDSGTGWPSFYAPAVGGAVSEHEDRSLFNAPNRGALRQMRVASWPCLLGRSQSHRHALLHQWRRSEARR
jgi:hypothetical protein